MNIYENLGAFGISLASNLEALDAMMSRKKEKPNADSKQEKVTMFHARDINDSGKIMYDGGYKYGIGEENFAKNLQQIVNRIRGNRSTKN